MKATTQAYREILDIKQSAEYLDVTDRTIRAYIARGDLRAHRIKGSRLIRIRRSDLDGLLRPVPTIGAAS